MLKIVIKSNARVEMRKICVAFKRPLIDRRVGYNLKIHQQTRQSINDVGKHNIVECVEDIHTKKC